MSERSSAGSRAVVIRVPRSSYFVLIFLVIGIAPVALYGGDRHPNQATISPLTALYLIPLLVAFYIALTATVVTSSGILIRAIFGRRALPWDAVQGLSVSGRSIYAVLREGGAVRLPNVRIHDLAAIAEASGGRLPEIPEVTVIPAPSPRRR